MKPPDTIAFNPDPRGTWVVRWLVNYFPDRRDELDGCYWYDGKDWWYRGAVLICDERNIALSRPDLFQEGDALPSGFSL